jgi:hypothetical protein
MNGLRVLIAADSGAQIDQIEVLNMQVNNDGTRTVDVYVTGPTAALETSGAGLQVGMV